jgi:hypothetical protein
VPLTFSWLFQWQYRRPWPTSAARDSFAARADLCHQYSLSPEKTKSQRFIAGVNDTAEKLFTGVNDTADKFFGGVSDTGD